MNLFNLLEAVKNMNPKEKEEYLDRYYKRERLIMSSTLDTIYRDQEEKEVI